MATATDRVGRRRSVADAGADAAGADHRDPAGGTGRRLRRRRALAARPADRVAGPGREDFDPFGELELRRGAWFQERWRWLPQPWPASPS